MWKIEYSQEVRNYIYDSYPYTATIWQTIKALCHTPNGLPPVNYIEIAPDTFLWQVEEHLVIYERHVGQRKLVFTVLKPGNGG